MATTKTETATKKTAKPSTTAAAKPVAVKPAAAKPTPAKPAAAKPVAKAAAAKPAAETKAAAPAAAKPSEGAAEPVAPLVVGAKAPDFKVTADDGSTVTLSSLAGKNVVLYFYPKDDTPGCTREACSFQENLGALTERGAVVIGVSRDSAKAHTGFKAKYGLSFPLLVDADSSLHKAYGAWGTKTNYGKTTVGAVRSTVILDKKGRVAKIFPTVKVDGHTAQVLAALDALKG